MNEERSKSWRRFKDKLKSRKGMGTEEAFKPEKKWKLMYLREEKLARAKQLGFTYPKKSGRQLLDQESPLDDEPR